MGYYDNLSPFQVCMANFSDEVAIIAGLEVGGRITEEGAYRLIKKAYRRLKKNHKEAKKANNE